MRLVRFHQLCFPQKVMFSAVWSPSPAQDQGGQSNHREPGSPSGCSSFKSDFYTESKLQDVFFHVFPMHFVSV